MINAQQGFIAVNGLACLALSWVAIKSRPAATLSDMERILSERGTQLLLEECVELYCLMLLFVLDVCSRYEVNKIWLVSIPLMSWYLGPCAPICFVYASLALCPERDSPDYRVVFFALAQAILIMLVFLIGIQTALTQPHSTLLLLQVPSLLLFAPSPRFSASSGLIIVNGAAMAVYLWIGALAFAAHTHEFHLLDTDKDQLIKEIVTQSLISGPSRFLFINFVHLVLASTLIIGDCQLVRGAVGLMSLGTTMAGPGSFAFFAALDKFLIVRRQSA